MTLITRRVLPVPDRFGNYYFGKPPICPAIFRSGSKDKPIRPDKFFASAGIAGEVLMAKGGVHYFATAEEALSALEEAGAFR